MAANNETSLGLERCHADCRTAVAAARRGRAPAIASLNRRRANCNGTTPPRQTPVLECPLAVLHAHSAATRADELAFGLHDTSSWITTSSR